MKGVEMKGDCRKLKIYTKLDLMINEALLLHEARHPKTKELDLTSTLSQGTLSQETLLSKQGKIRWKK